MGPEDFKVTVQGFNPNLKFSDLSSVDRNNTMQALYDCVLRVLEDPAKRAEYEAFKVSYHAEQEAKAALAAGGNK